MAIATNPEEEAAATDLDRLVNTPGTLGVLLRKRSRERQTRILLFVDQFEELYTLSTDATIRSAFLRNLDGAADDASSPIRVILSFRSDFLDRLTEDRAFCSEVTQGLVLLPPMRREDLRQTLVAPLEATEFCFETDETVEAALDAVAHNPSPLPLLQFTASELWEARDRARKLLTHDSYVKLGGVAGALAGHADAVYSGLSKTDRRLARRVFTHLVTEDRTRAVVGMSELRALVPGFRTEAIEHVIHGLARARLLLIETGAAQEAMVELSHESLIERWPRLGRWLNENQEEDAFRARLHAAAKEWDDHGRMEALVWTGPLANEVQRWQAHWQSSTEDGKASNARFDTSLGDRDAAFVDAVTELALRVRRRRRRWVVAAIAGLLMISSVVSGLAIEARQAADRADHQARYAQDQATVAKAQAKEATKQAILARNATKIAVAREMQTDASLVLALIRELEPEYAPKRWRELAYSALEQGVARVVLEHPTEVLSAAFGTDDHRIMTVGDDRIVRIYHLDGAAESVVVPELPKRAWSATLSSDGAQIVSVSGKSAWVSKVDGSGTPIALRGHRGRVWSAAFSPNDDRIVTASWDRTARIYLSNGGGDPIVLEGHLDRLMTAVFSPDGTRVLTSSFDKTARIYDAEGAGTLAVLTGHEQAVWSAAFSPDGKRVVTASLDQTARVFDVVKDAPSIEATLVLKGHLQRVLSASFSPDGTRIVTASGDGTIRVYDARDGRLQRVLRGHRDRVNTATFSPSGRYILSASLDGTVRVWDVDVQTPVILRGHTGRLLSAAFSRDSTRVITTSNDKTARIWNADGSEAPVVLEGHAARVHGGAFSPDGNHVVTASSDRTARIWNVDGQSPPTVLDGHTARVVSAVYSPDGRRIVTASDDKTARVWTIDGTALPIILRGHTDGVWSAAFSPDGRKIATASTDHTLRIWNADGTGEPDVLKGHDQRLLSVAFSPDGRKIATASIDKTVRIWNSDGTGEPTVLKGHESLVLAGAPGGQGTFSPDGHRVVTVSNDKTIRIWSLNRPLEPVILHSLDLAAYSAAFSPDGTRLVTASHSLVINEPGQPERIEHVAKIRRDVHSIANLDDRTLWAPTTYCPSVELRMKLLDLPIERAEQERARCLESVKHSVARRSSPN